jgi:hypothetical protein
VILNVYGLQLLGAVLMALGVCFTVLVLVFGIRLVIVGWLDVPTEEDMG